MTTEQSSAAEIEPGLKYSEDAVRMMRTHPVRYCYLWKTGVDEPVSELEVHTFGQRFGGITVPAEGIGGVETLPPFRRQGLLRKLLTRVMADAAQRVAVLFVSDGIEGAYEQFGFVNCLAEGTLVVPVRNVERLASSGVLPTNQQTRDFTPADLPAMVNLYNTVHAARPWTHERPSDWNRLQATETWRPGSAVLILEREAHVVGYAIWQEQQFGWPIAPLVVDELTASDAAAAGALLAEIAARGWQLRLSEFQIREPLDSVVGRAAQRLGCEYRRTFPASGGMMGAILDRQQLLVMLEPELRRRLASADQRALHGAAFARLCRGELLPDNAILLRLLLGHWSMADALADDAPIASEDLSICQAWFPGGGTQHLLLPYAHKLDRY